MLGHCGRWVFFDFDCVQVSIAYEKGVAEVNQLPWLGLIASTHLESAEHRRLPSLGRPRPGTAKGQIVNTLQREPKRFTVVCGFPARRWIESICEIITIVLVIELYRRYQGNATAVSASQSYQGFLKVGLPQGLVK
jgi:hypothetical protein